MKKVILKTNKEYFNFINKYKKAINASSGSEVDANANVDNKKTEKTDDEELNAFLFSLGCYSGEPITVVSERRGTYVVSIKDARYNIDKNLAKAISI